MSIFLRQNPNLLRRKNLLSLIFLRPMGGGPRTFPGGINKWKWKRLHEKKAREKEKHLLDTEKQLYQARLRSQIRASVFGRPGPARDHGPLSPREHVRALADRFVKPGAEDLWNEADGPIRSPAKSVGGDGGGGGGCGGGNWQQRRGYFSSINLGNSGNLLQKRWFGSEVRGKSKLRVYKKRYVGSSSDECDEDFGPVVETARWPKFVVENKGKEGEDEEGEGGRKTGARGFIGGKGVLGKYDVKIKKKNITRELDKYIEEEDEGPALTAKVQEIKKEFMRRKNGEMVEDDNAGGGGEEVVDDFVASGKRFDESGISPLTVKALTDAGYVTMTKVQEETLYRYLEGKDVLVKSRAGTGKTTAFLLPAIETVLKAGNSDKALRLLPIYVLVLCPTRELASQIGAETRVLLKYHEGLGVQVLSGGTRFKDDLRRLELEPCQILVATPGRLLDHIESKSSLSRRLIGLQMLVLDEADHLLELGFRKDMEKISDCLPRRRQSMLFSATVPKEVRRISQLVLKRGHVCINTVEEGSPDTNHKVKQSYIVASHDMHFQVVYQLLKEHISRMPDYKVIVFCTTGMVTSLMYLLFREMRLNVREIHSRKPQLYRSRISDEFKQSKGLILISSDVSARGMNYPDVSLVIQVGIPTDKEQYIHRVGRTGREGKEGEGILVLAPWEEHFLEEIKDLHVEQSPAPLIHSEVKSKMDEAMSKVDINAKEAAYHAWLGYYNTLRETGRDKTSLANWASQFSQSIGLEKPPALFRKTAVKMGLKDIPGIRLRRS